MDPFTVVPTIIGIGFVVVIIGIFFVIGKSVAQWASDNAQPVLTTSATLVSKRTQTSGSGGADGMNSVSTYYYATFELTTGERMEFRVRGQEYGLLAEGDEGELTYQGSRYQGFARRPVLSRSQ